MATMAITCASSMPSAPCCLSFRSTHSVKDEHEEIKCVPRVEARLHAFAARRLAMHRGVLQCTEVAFAVMRARCNASFDGLAKDGGRGSFSAAVVSDDAKGLVNVFLAQRSTSKVPGIIDLGLRRRKITKLAIIGGGLLGSGIVTALILSGYPVLLKEINDKFLQQGFG